MAVPLSSPTAPRFGARIYKSTDQGATWQFIAGISASLPLKAGVDFVTGYLARLLAGDIGVPSLALPCGLFFGLEGELVTQRLNPSTERTVALLMDGVAFSSAYTEDQGSSWTWLPVAVPGAIDRPWVSVCPEKVLDALPTGLVQPAPFTLIAYAYCPPVVGLPPAPPPALLNFATGQTGYGSSVSLDGGKTWLPRPVQSSSSVALLPENKGDLRVSHSLRNIRGRLFATAPSAVRVAPNLPTCTASPTILRVHPANLRIYRGYYPNPIESEYINHNLASRWVDLAVDQGGTLYVLRYLDDTTTILYRSFDYGFSLTQVHSFTGPERVDGFERIPGPWMTANKLGQVAIAYRMLDTATNQWKIFVKKITGAHTSSPVINTFEVGLTVPPVPLGRLDLLDLVWNSQDKLRIGMVDSAGKPAVAREL